ncbi:hypothetical protein BC629DRAFT_1587955 [Irpex lacteus]|nr:hypothetical protein BC629DRAFT_1587955 [Irpex lacteus]
MYLMQVAKDGEVHIFADLNYFLNMPSFYSCSDAMVQARYVALAQERVNQSSVNILAHHLQAIVLNQHYFRKGLLAWHAGVRRRNATQEGQPATPAKLRDLTTNLMLRNQELEERVAALEAQRQQTPPTPPMDFQPTGMPSLWQGRVSSSLPIPANPQSQQSVTWGQSRFIVPEEHGFLYDAPPMSIPFPQMSPSQHIPQHQVTDAEIRSVFRAHAIVLGIYLRPAKWDAIEKGDLSGTVVHPAMVHLALLNGGVYYLIQRGGGQLPFDLDLQLHRALAAVEQQTPDPITPYRFMASSRVRVNHLRIAYPIMNTILGLGEPDDDTQEQITALCQMVYLDKSAELVLKLPPVLPKEFEEQVDKIPFFQPWLSKHSAIVTRCRSVHFLQKALQLSASAPVAGLALGLEQDEWYEKYWATLEDITHNVSAVSTEMLKASLCGDTPQSVSLKVCLIIFLSAQLELHRLPGLYHEDSRQRVVDGVSEIVGLTRGFKDEESSLLCPMLGVCWTVVATALRQEKQAFVDMSSLAPEGNWARAFSVMISCASKVGARMPFLEHALYALHEVAIEPQSDVPMH